RVNYHADGRLKEFTPQAGFPPLIHKGNVENLDACPTSSAILTPHTEFSDMYLVEVSRGCRHHCSFCLVGCAYQPLRFYRSETLRAQIDEGLALTHRIGLVGAALADHPDLIGLCRAIVDRGGQVHPASLRLEGISTELMDLLTASGLRTVTLAPEAGSERLRQVINKGLSEEQILEKTIVALEGGISHLKLYFMLGLPTEEQEDVEAIVKLTKRICHMTRKACHSRRPPWNIQLSISPFVPKPFTPFQWEAMEEVASLSAKLKQIQRALARIKQVRVFFNLPKWSYVQALLSRGDRRVGDLLQAAHHLRGDWRRAFREVNLNPDYYVYRRWEEDELLPWSHIDLGIDQEALKKKRKGLAQSYCSHLFS
ncbi:MAG: radical SAM protein, partial [Candidatus Binatia bacterium]